MIFIKLRENIKAVNLNKANFGKEYKPIKTFLTK